MLGMGCLTCSTSTAAYLTSPAAYLTSPAAYLTSPAACLTYLASAGGMLRKIVSTMQVAALWVGT